jgi:hypothetical protein
VSGGGHTIQEESADLPQRRKLNFIGTGVTAEDDAGNDATNVTINAVADLTPSGEWSAVTAYDANDVVSYLGSSYIANVGNTNKTPGVDPEWTLLAQKGEGGVDGADGVGLVGGALTLDHVATPSDPGAGKTVIYGKTDGKVYRRPAGGAETEVGGMGFSPLTDKALYYYDGVSGLMLPVGIGTLDQVLVAKPALSPPYQWAAPSGGGREVLTANRTYYVRTDGNDDNNGFTDTAGGAFLTGQKALDVVGSLDISIYNVTVQFGAGTHSITSFLNVKSPVGSGVVILRGDPANPANVVISSTTTAIVCNCRANIDGFRIVSGGVGNAIQVGMPGLVYIYNIQFGSNNRCIYALSGGSAILLANTSVTANCSSFLEAKEASYIRVVNGLTVTFSGTPTITTFASAYTMGLIVLDAALAFSGATSAGKKYDVSIGGLISSSGTTFPGATLGTIATGGQYL